jgi:hypothetical protein
MRYIALLLFVLSGNILHAQKIDTLQTPSLPMIADKVMYTEVVKTIGVSASDLYQRAKHFFIEYYKDAKAVIQFDDSLNHEIIGKGILKITWDQGEGYIYETSLKHTLTIYCKDGRYKYEIANMATNYTVADIPIELSLETVAKRANPVFINYSKSVDLNIQQMVFRLKETMSKKTEAQKDW